jgi:hypothetical protein
VSGSWELKANRQVLAYTLHTDTVTLAWSCGFRNLIIPGGFLPLAGMPFDMARNTACKACLEQGFQWLFSLDSDVIPPRDTILRLMAHNRPIISGVYCRRSPPHGVPVMIRNRQWVTQYPPNSLIEVDYVGAGCLLIHRSVLEQMPPQRPEAGKTYFDWRVDMLGLGIRPTEDCLSEDFTMCVHAKKTLGIPTIVDTSIMCRHVGYSEVIYNSMLPLSTNPNT